MACKKMLTLNNGLLMPALGIGTWQAPDSELEAALNLALEAGYRHIDAAPVYRNEKAIGRVLNNWLTSQKLKREDLYIVTKLPVTAIRASCVEKYLKISLDDLQLSYVDMYLIHTPFGFPETEGGFDFVRDSNGDIVLDTDTDLIETWKKMEKMVKLGLTKSIGVSNFNKSQLKRILENSTIKPANLQIEIHVYLQQNELVDFCKGKDVVVTAYAPLGSRGIADFSKKAGVNREITDLLDIPEVISIAKHYNKTPAQVLLRWIVDRGIAAIPKSTNPERLKQNLDIFDFCLSEDEMKTMSKLDADVRVCDLKKFWIGIEKHPECPF